MQDLPPLHLPQSRHSTELRERGFTLIELLISLLVSSVVLSAAIATFGAITRLGNDNELMIIAQLEAQSALEMLTSDFRMIGNGVPFHQSNFLIGQQNLSDNTVTQPILVDGTTHEQIKFRLNESGETYIVTSDFDPAASTEIQLTSVTKIIEGDQIYITNSTVAGDDGLWAVVSSINPSTNTVTIEAGAQYSAGATFSNGSLLEVVPVITYTSNPEDYTGITRNDGLGELVLVPTGLFNLEYLNSAGDEVTLPLIASPDDPFPDSAIQNVHAIRITVRVRSTTPLSNGQFYIATAEQSVGIRNLNFKY